MEEKKIKWRELTPEERKEIDAAIRNPTGDTTIHMVHYDMSEIEKRDTEVHCKLKIDKDAIAIEFYYEEDQKDPRVFVAVAGFTLPKEYVSKMYDKLSVAQINFDKSFRKRMGIE